MVYFAQGRPATILNTATTSNEVAVQNSFLVGIRIPAAFTGTALTFQNADASGGTFNTVYKDDGTPYSVTVAAGRYVALDHLKFLGCQFVRVVSGSAEGADRALILYTRMLVP